MIKIDWQSGIPAYDQIVQGFIRLKALGAMLPGQQMPSVRGMAMQLGVNPNTVQKAYFILEEKGIIYSVAGKGSFIADSAKADNAVKESAKAGLKKAAAEAFRLGLSAEEAKEIIKEIFISGGQNND